MKGQVVVVVAPVAVVVAACFTCFSLCFFVFAAAVVRARSAARAQARANQARAGARSPLVRNHARARNYAGRGFCHNFVTETTRGVVSVTKL